MPLFYFAGLSPPIDLFIAIYILSNISLYTMRLLS